MSLMVLFVKIVSVEWQEEANEDEGGSDGVVGKGHR